MDGSALLFGTSVDLDLRWQYDIYQVQWVAWIYQLCAHLRFVNWVKGQNFNLVGYGDSVMQTEGSSLLQL